MTSTIQREQLIDLVKVFLRGQVHRNRLGAVDIGEISSAVYARLHLNGNLAALLCSFKDQPSDWLIIRDQLSSDSIPISEFAVPEVTTPQYLANIILDGYLYRQDRVTTPLVAWSEDNEGIPFKEGHDIVFKFKVDSEQQEHVSEIIPASDMASALNALGIPLEDDRTSENTVWSRVH